MQKVNVAIMGVTGAVGQEMLNLLLERKFPVNRLKAFSGPQSAGKRIDFGSESVAAEEIKPGCFKGVDIVLGAVSADLSRLHTPDAVAEGAVVVDNSSAFRTDADVPLVIPEINPEDVKAHKGIIANPNCSTIISLMAVYALNKRSPITRMIASTYQAVSGAGKEGLAELDKQIIGYAEKTCPENKVFQYQIFNNLIPHIDEFMENGYSKEEMKMLNEGRKILHSPDMKISCTCVRVPIMRSHSVSLTIETKEEIGTEEAKRLIAAADGVKLLDDVSNKIYPMPILSSNQDLIHVGRLRRDLSGSGLSLWCCGDQIRKGAATNAVQIAELLL